MRVLCLFWQCACSQEITNDMNLNNDGKCLVGSLQMNHGQNGNNWGEKGNAQRKGGKRVEG